MIRSFFFLILLDPRESAPRLKFAAAMVTRWLFRRLRGTLAVQLGAQRMKSCQMCPLYDSAHQTCGHIPETVEDPVTKRMVPLGCWCYLPVAAQLPEKDCWARANDLDVGWPDSLRP